MAAMNNFKTPPTVKRLPRALSGTKEARERKKQLQKLRQRRKRARERAEEARREVLVTSSSEEEVEDCNNDQTAALEDEDEEDGENPHHQPHFQDLPPDDHDIIARREVITGQLQADSRQTAASARDMDVDSSPPSYVSSTTEAVNEIARQFAVIKCSSFVTDAAMNKLFRMFVTNNTAIMRLVNEGVIVGNYTNGVRPLLTRQILPIHNSVLLKETAAGVTRYKRLKNLTAIPVEYLTLPANSGTTLLRMETYVHLRDIKELHLRLHGDTQETRKQLKNCAVSADGVAESKMGSRTFMVVIIRIGTCIYLVRIFNPLIGVEESKPSAKEILRYTWAVTGK